MKPRAMPKPSPLSQPNPWRSAGLLTALLLACVDDPMRAPTPPGSEDARAHEGRTALAASAPSALQLDEQSVDENAPAGTVVGLLSATGLPAPVFTLSGPDAAAFVIPPGSQQLRTATALDYEEKPVRRLTVTAANSAGSVSLPITLYVNDVPDSPLQGQTASERYELQKTFANWADYTSPFSIEFTAQLTAQSRGIIFEKGDASTGSAVWCEGGKLKARIGAGGDPTQVCTLELDLSVLTGNNTYVFTFTPGNTLKLSAYVNGNKVAWRENGSHPTSANGSGGGYGLRGGSTLPVGVLDEPFSNGTLGATLSRYHGTLPLDP
jgi:hypothetical protein